MRSFGRESEFRILGRMLGESESGTGGIVVVSGEAGAGKTTLLGELASKAVGDGFKVVNVPYWSPHISVNESIWTRLVEACSEDDVSLIVQPGEISSESRYESSNAVSNGSFDRFQARDRLEPEAAEFCRISDGLSKAAARRPILVILDDLGVADEFSLRLTAYLARNLRSKSVLVAAAYREFEFTDAPRHLLVDAIKRYARNIELVPLARRAIDELLESLIGRPLEPKLVERVQELTGGIPRLIVESEPLLIDGGEAITSSSGLSAIPLGISVAVHERLAGLSASASEILKCAAVIGNRFDPELVLQIAELNRDEAMAALSALEDHRIIGAESDGRRKFTQGFVREILYRELASDVRALRHRRIAATLQARHTHEIESHAEDIAHNLVLSRDGPAMDDAVGFAEIAGRRFLRAGAFAKACEMFTLALDAAQWRGRQDDLRLCEILTEKGIAQRDAGDLSAAEVTFQSAVYYARRIGDPVRLARLALQVPEYHWPLPGWDSPLAILLAEGALSSLDARDSALRAMVTARLAAELSYDRGQKQRGHELAKLSVEIAGKAGADPAAMMQVLRFRDCTLRHPDCVEERLSNSSKVMSLARQLSDPVVLHEAVAAMIWSLFKLGRMSEAEALFPTFEQTVKLANRPLYRIFMFVSLASWAAHEGRVARSESLFAEARKSAEEAGIPSAVERCWPTLILSLVERDNLANLEPMAAASLRARPRSLEDRALKCWLDARLGHHFEARLRLERLAADDFADLRDDQNFLIAAAALGEACIGLGRNYSHYAARIYELLLPYANLQVALGQIAAMTSVSYYLGRLAKFLARRDAAIEHLQTALDLDLRMASRPFTLYASFELAEALLGHRDSDRRHQGSMLLAGLEAQAASEEMPALAMRTSGLRMNGVAVDSLAEDSDHPDSAGVASLSFGTDKLSFPALTEVGSFANAITNQSRVFKREGDVWTLCYQKRIVRVHHLKGLALISQLLARTNEPIHCMELANSVDAGRSLPGETLRSAQSIEMGPMLDQEAKHSYRERARELRQELEEAHRFNDAGRAEKIEQELRFLTRELARAIGLFGHDRENGSSGERARLRVTFAIKSAINKIASSHITLARHLESSIRTGRFCTYRPDAEELHWEL